MFCIAVQSESASAQPHGNSAQKKHKLTDSVGVVNSEVITFFDFRARLSERIEQAARAGEVKNKKVTPEQYTKFVDATWEDMIRDVIVEHEIHKRKLPILTATDAEVRARTLQDPPFLLKRSFTDSLGKFDTSALRAVLTDPSYDSVATMILAEQRDRYERAALKVSITPHAANDAALEAGFAAWYKRERKRARLLDFRTAFGFY